MKRTLVFIQVQGRPGIIEAELPESAEVQDIYDVLDKTDVEVEDEMVVFIDEAKDYEERQCGSPVRGLKHGSRIYVTRCRRVDVAIHFLENTIERKFPPGARVHAVKQWAVRKLQINATDAGEHILQLCDSTKQPPTDTPLTELIEDRACKVCLDLVPEKRVEG